MAADAHMERVTVTLTHEQVLALKGLAAKNKVTMAWIVRHAVEQLLNDGPEAQPLLRLSKAS